MEQGSSVSSQDDVVVVDEPPAAGAVAAVPVAPVAEAGARKRSRFMEFDGIFMRFQWDIFGIFKTFDGLTGILREFIRVLWNLWSIGIQWDLRYNRTKQILLQQSVT